MQARDMAAGGVRFPGGPLHHRKAYGPARRVLRVRQSDAAEGCSGSGALSLSGAGFLRLPGGVRDFGRLRHQQAPDDGLHGTQPEDDLAPFLARQIDLGHQGARAPADGDHPAHEPACRLPKTGYGGFVVFVGGDSGIAHGKMLQRSGVAGTT